MTKVTTSIRIDGELWKTFIKFVMVKRGKLYGTLAQEFSQALACYMVSDAAHESAQTRTGNFKFSRRSTETAELIGAKIDELFPDHMKLERKQVEQAIGQTPGLSPDPRHYRKYIPMLEGLGIIRHWKFGVYDLPRRGIRKEAEVTIGAIRQAEAG